MSTLACHIPQDLYILISFCSNVLLTPAWAVLRCVVSTISFVSSAFTKPPCLSSCIVAHQWHSCRSLPICTLLPVLYSTLCDRWRTTAAERSKKMLCVMQKEDGIKRSSSAHSLASSDTGGPIDRSATPRPGMRHRGQQVCTVIFLCVPCCALAWPARALPC